MAWPTAEARKAAAKKPTTKKAAPKDKIVKLPQEPAKKKLAAKSLPLKKNSQEGQRTYRGQATLGGSKVRSSPTFQKLVVDGQKYVLVPEHEHGAANTEKADALVGRLREIRNELFEEGNCTFSLAGRQIGIAIALLRETGAGEQGETDDE